MTKEHDIEAILQKPSDYKICADCGRLNWYENEVCVGCGMVDLFHKLDEDDVQNLANDIKKYNLRILFV